MVSNEELKKLMQRAGFRNTNSPYEAVGSLDAFRALLEAYESGLKEDAERLDWLEAQTKESRTGISFDRSFVDSEDRGFRFMRFHFIGDRRPSIREAIDSVRLP